MVLQSLLFWCEPSVLVLLHYEQWLPDCSAPQRTAVGAAGGTRRLFLSLKSQVAKSAKSVWLVSMCRRFPCLTSSLCSAFLSVLALQRVGAAAGSRLRRHGVQVNRCSGGFLTFCSSSSSRAAGDINRAAAGSETASDLERLASVSL